MEANWISVKDQEPPLGEELIIFGIAYGTPAMELTSLYTYKRGGSMGELCKGVYCPSGVDGHDCNSELDYKDITHWMLAPKQPTK